MPSRNVPTVLGSQIDQDESDSYSEQTAMSCIYHQGKVSHNKGLSERQRSVAVSRTGGAAENGLVDRELARHQRASTIW
jgi:hypothetical protein